MLFLFAVIPITNGKLTGKWADEETQRQSDQSPQLKRQLAFEDQPEDNGRDKHPNRNRQNIRFEDGHKTI